ncbi:transglutaminase family protein [Prosthecomicrobium sp. N25]|uniref:transglutaminase family protein n=1 Tax=Prosthecomicrobium sp. N25 TaxID=3129254 RepID=UPI003078A4D2
MRIRHRTTYRYARPVALDPHRLLLRPRDGIAIQVQACKVEVSPAASLSWSVDVCGNAVATATFATPTDHLVIDSDVLVGLSTPPWPVFDIAYAAQSYPFRYSDEDWTDLGALALPQYEDPAGRLLAWAQGFVAPGRTDTLSLLMDLNLGIGRRIAYQSREDEGTQSPLQTLDRGWGACRDYAVLFAEAARVLGFGTRLVSGYVHDPDHIILGSGSTHAWAEVYLPGAGWIPFDPTNGRMGGHNLVPVAVGRRMTRIMPVTGSFFGPSDAFLGMSVEVALTD